METEVPNPIVARGAAVFETGKGLPYTVQFLRDGKLYQSSKRYLTVSPRTGAVVESDSRDGPWEEVTPLPPTGTYRPSRS